MLIVASQNKRLSPNSSPKSETAKKKKRASLQVDALEARILLSGSWVDADTVSESSESEETLETDLGTSDTESSERTDLWSDLDSDDPSKSDDSSKSGDGVVIEVKDESTTTRSEARTVDSAVVDAETETIEKSAVEPTGVTESISIEAGESVPLSFDSTNIPSGTESIVLSGFPRERHFRKAKRNKMELGLFPFPT